MLAEHVAAVHRGVHGSRYGFRPPYTQFSVPTRNAHPGGDPYTNQYFSRYLRTGPTHYAAAVKPDRSPRDEPANPALRDASEILARAAADETAAIEARERYRSEGLPAVEPDPEIALRLRAGEGVVEVRPGAMLGRARLAGSVASEDPISAGDLALGQTQAGRLYLTTSRLVLLTRPSDSPDVLELSVELASIEELALVGERLLVSLVDGTGLTIDAGRPRLLRVQVAAARAASRSEGQPSLEGVPAPIDEVAPSGLAELALEA
jgi:hypothetical protein